MDVDGLKEGHGQSLQRWDQAENRADRVIRRNEGRVAEKLLEMFE